MTVAPSTSRPQGGVPGFRHEAMFYAGQAGLVQGVVPFVQDAIAAGEPVLVALPAPKLVAIRNALAEHSGEVLFADMFEVGRNPARIIPVWHRFLAGHAAGDRPVRGVGEPVWAGRSRDELAECYRHEELLNVAFAGAPAWWLVCPYDVEALAPAVIADARRSHPVVTENGHSQESHEYVGLDAAAGPFDRPLSDPPAPPDELQVDAAGALDAVRHFVAEKAPECGLDRVRAAEAVIAVNEVVTNSLRHGGGTARVRTWAQDRTLVCEVEDAGWLRHQLAGREPPAEAPENGMGLWLVNQLCDLVQIRSTPRGTVVRLHVGATRS